MYSPKFNQVTERAILIEAMQAYSFATLIGPQSTPESPAPLVATHLPLVVKDEGPHGLIEGKFAHGGTHNFGQMRPATHLNSHFMRQRANIGAGGTFDTEAREGSIDLQ